MLLQLIFIALQLADFTTTLIALHLGGAEANPIVSRLLVVGSLQGLIFSKVLVLTLGVAAVMARKFRVIKAANVVYAGVVLWNIVALVALSL